MQLRNFIEWVEERLANLPAVSTKVVLLAVLDFLTLGLISYMCVFKDTSDGVPLINAWLFFLAGIHGVNAATFGMAVKSPTTTPGGLQIKDDGDHR